MSKSVLLWISLLLRLQAQGAHGDVLVACRHHRFGLWAVRWFIARWVSRDQGCQRRAEEECNGPVLCRLPARISGVPQLVAEIAAAP
jgi:hypothetical protein